MIVDHEAEPVPPRTLAEAHHALANIRPRLDASPQQWLAYHQRSAALYAEIAEIDRGHHHEALAFADRERKNAQRIKDQAGTQES
ncbi:MAG: hypothetical protein JO287_27655 [Pseudonocardiales bacterium]|nr:hypothetical protein [Pseudonocardiales bacterium]